MPTGKEIREAAKKSMLWLSKNKHMFEPEREHDAIELIKCKGNHIGYYEARTIFEVARLMLMGDYCNTLEVITLTESVKEKLYDISHNIGWVEEYIETVGEKHKQAYIDGLEYALKLIREIIDEIT